MLTAYPLTGVTASEEQSGTMAVELFEVDVCWLRVLTAPLVESSMLVAEWEFDGQRAMDATRIAATTTTRTDAARTWFRSGTGP